MLLIFNTLPLPQIVCDTLYLFVSMYQSSYVILNLDHEFESTNFPHSKLYPLKKIEQKNTQFHRDNSYYDDGTL